MQAARDAAREEAVGEPVVPADARLWMALAPGWTEMLASACQFPGIDTLPAHELFQRMVDSGMANAFVGDERADAAFGSPYYVMTPASRAEILRPFVVDDVTVVSQYSLA